MTDNCKCEKDKVKKQSINQMLDQLIEQKKQNATERLINTMVSETLQAISNSMKEKAVYQRLNQCGGRTKYSNDFVNAFEPLLRKKIIKMLKEIS
jgi:predicted Zn-dependent peptidase